MINNWFGYFLGRGAGQEKLRSDCSGQVSFALGKVKIEVFWFSGQVKIPAVVLL